MATLHFELVSPARAVFSGDVASVVIPGSEGEMTIWPQHAPLLAMLKPGIIAIATGHGEAVEKIFVQGGFAEINQQGLIVLAELAVPLADLDAASLVQQINLAEKRVLEASNDDSKRLALEQVDHLKNLQGLV